MSKGVLRKFKIVRYVIRRETAIDKKEMIWTFIGSFCGIGLIGILQQSLLFGVDVFFLIGSFGASCVLVFGARQSPLAQPRNLVWGHLISSVIGVGCSSLFGLYPMFAAAMSVGVSMQFTKTLHPPGGATALIAVIGSEQIKSLGWWYVLFPVLSGVIVLLFVSFFVNNLSTDRKIHFTVRLNKIFSKSK